MQEVEVPPRDIFQHYIYVDQKGKNLLWYFSTKRKNISFGLYYRKQTVASSSDLFVASSANLAAPNPRNVNITTGSSTSIPNSNSSEIVDYEIGDDDTSICSLQDSYNPIPKTIRKSSSIFLTSKDPNLTEIIPVGHYESSKATIKGSYLVQEPGTYVLCFDNSFSRNTSKKLTFFVGLKDGPDEKKSEPEISGWLLKKKRKKMQGWAKRWVQIDKGVLSYFKNPQSFCRGSIQIPLSVIFVVPGHRAINIDSGSCLYSLRALNAEDFELWMDVIKKYSKQSEDRPISESPQNEFNGSTKSKTSNAEDLRISTLRQEASNTLEPSPSFTKAKEEYSTLLSQLNEAKSYANSIKQYFLDSATNNIIESELSDANANNHSSTSSSATLKLAEQLESCLLNIEKASLNLGDVLSDESDKNVSLKNTINHLERENEDLKENLGISAEEDNRSFTKRISRPASVASSIGTGDDEFFDAPEIIISEDTSGDDDQVCTEDSSQIDDDDDDDDESFIEQFDLKEGNNSVGHELHDLKNSPHAIHRRSVLPSPICGPDVSILSILRKNVGKDLSSVAMPIALNEPLNLLQRLCEELEYSELLDKASEFSDSIDRLTYVTAFALSAYGSTQSRTGRKPFNPLLGETYECVRPDKGFRFISEKVSHHPPIMACYAESLNFKFWQDSKINSKFWGKSMEMVPFGTVHVELMKYNEQYTYSKPSTWVRNMLAGTRYLEHTGDVRITNHSTKEYCILTFKEGGFFKSSNNEVHAALHDAEGNVVRTLSGKWHHALWHNLGEDKLEIIWRAHSPHPSSSEMYGFTQFAMELNEITPDIADKLPQTDTRLRPDQKLFEHGKVDEAEEEKLRVEQLQRERRKQSEIAGEVWSPQWFEKKPDPHSPESESWLYSGGYWEARAQGVPPAKVKLW
ncbi:Oxysterol-binding protein 3 [Basidiobolus ranarum]|uniref:Oxysterol-binding protein 3 n=1 Tax=Basidiobolus ranarum TaxID=34480 RepID=A0ABR2WXZ1_9FUNG